MSYHGYLNEILYEPTSRIPSLDITARNQLCNGSFEDIERFLDFCGLSYEVGPWDSYDKRSHAVIKLHKIGYTEPHRYGPYNMTIEPISVFPMESIIIPAKVIVSHHGSQSTEIFRTKGELLDILNEYTMLRVDTDDESD